MKNKIISAFVMLLIMLSNIQAFACDACQKQQPKFTRGITHGAGPQSDWDWLIVAVISAITILTFIFSLKFLIKPGEKNDDHIKKSILRT